MTEKEFKEMRRQVACYMRRLYKRGLTTASGGNVSIRLEEGILITPSAMDKGSIKGKQVGMISFKGKNLTPSLKPSIESNMHLEIYRNRKDVNAIVHAHPPIASSFTATSVMINCSLIAEARAIIGIPVTAPYALMGTEQLAQSVVSVALKEDVNVILLENHGIVCLGKNLLTAFDRMEVFEAAAKMTLITSLIGNEKPLSEDRLKEIDRLMQG
ncbi:MAG TPA: class II aldolase/adducin family protein [Bacteroidales bacterium]|jgi:L-fuculose-phosphate aldolase|nr:class II aldolase/adducin family protein [Bacteroidales bacterium]